MKHISNGWWGGVAWKLLCIKCLWSPSDFNKCFTSSSHQNPKVRVVGSEKSTEEAQRHSWRECLNAQYEKSWHLPVISKSITNTRCRYLGRWCTFTLVESLSSSAVFLVSFAMLCIHFVSLGSVLKSVLSFLSLIKSASWLLHPCALICRPRSLLNCGRACPLNNMEAQWSHVLGIFFPIYLYFSCLILLHW